MTTQRLLTRGQNPRIKASVKPACDKCLVTVLSARPGRVARSEERTTMDSMTDAARPSQRLGVVTVAPNRRLRCTRTRSQPRRSASAVLAARLVFVEAIGSACGDRQEQEFVSVSGAVGAGWPRVRPLVGFTGPPSRWWARRRVPGSDALVSARFAGYVAR